MKATGGPAMAKRRGRPESGRDDVTVKLDRAVVAKAKLIAAHRGTTVAELLTEAVKGPIDRLYLAMLRELGKPEEN